MPLGTKSPLIIIEHKQTHGFNIVGCYGLDGILLTIWHDKRSKAIGKRCEHSVFHKMGWHCRTCFGGVARRNGCNANATSRGDSGMRCIVWRIGYMPNKVCWAGTKCCHSTIGTTRGIRRGHSSRKKMFEFHGKHWTPPSNVDWYEGTISKRCWSICEGNQTKFKPYASCTYFGSILSYIDGGEARKNASGIPWRWEVLITRFDIMA